MTINKAGLRLWYLHMAIHGFVWKKNTKPGDEHHLQVVGYICTNLAQLQPALLKKIKRTASNTDGKSN